MKKLTAFALLSLLMLSFVSCSSKKGQDYLNANVLEITDTEILVQCIDESTGQLTGTTLAVSRKVIAASGVPEMEAGNTIRVVYDFDNVDKSGDPVRIEHVYAIYLLDESGNVISN